MDICGLMSGFLGNGLSIWKEGTNDIVAHIDKNRNINMRVDINSLSKQQMNYILHTAKTDDRDISITQKEKVFEIQPVDKVEIKLKK